MVAVVKSSKAYLRQMLETDVDEVLRNDEAAYEYPWTRGIFSDCLRVGYICKILELDDEIVGHLIASVGAQETHLLNICVHPNQQGKGFGKYLLNHCLSLPEVRRTKKIYLEVRPSNWQAIRLYQMAGFSVIGRRPNYYRATRSADHAMLIAPREDALVMARQLSYE